MFIWLVNVYQFRETHKTQDIFRVSQESTHSQRSACLGDVTLHTDLQSLDNTQNRRLMVVFILNGPLQWVHKTAVHNWH